MKLTSLKPIKIQRVLATRIIMHTVIRINRAIRVQIACNFRLFNSLVAEDSSDITAVLRRFLSDTDLAIKHERIIVWVGMNVIKIAMLANGFFLLNFLIYWL